MRLIGTSEFALRALSWLGGILAVALIAMLARRWFGDRLALLAVLVMATQPMLITHARDDTRMYTLLMALALLNVWTLDRALVRNWWRDWALFCITLSIMLGLHYLSGLILLSYTIFLVICWRKLSPSRSRFALVLGGLFGLGLAWILLQRGPRSSALAAIETVIHTPRSPVPLKLVFTQWPLGGVADYLPLAGALLLASFSCCWPLSYPADEAHAANRVAWLSWLFALLIVVPPFIAFLVLPFTTARHTSATLGLFVLALTLGVASFWGRARLVGLVLFLVLLGLNVDLSFRQIASGQQAFSAPMHYVSDRARADEPLIYTYYFDWPLDDYYNRQFLPVGYIPDADVQLTEADAAARAAAMLNDASSLWLMLYPGLDNTDRVEQAFNRLAFAAERVWFPGDLGWSATSARCRGSSRLAG